MIMNMCQIEESFNLSDADLTSSRIDSNLIVTALLKANDQDRHPKSLLIACPHCLSENHKLPILPVERSISKLVKLRSIWAKDCAGSSFQ